MKFNQQVSSVEVPQIPEDSIIASGWGLNVGPTRKPRGCPAHLFFHLNKF